MNTKSPLTLVKQLQADILRIIRSIDVADLSTAQQKILSELTNDLFDTRLEIMDYESAESRADRHQPARLAKLRLARIDKTITSGKLEMFGPVDVVHTSAYIEQIQEKLR